MTDGLVKIPKIPKKLRLNIINQQNKIGQIKFYKKLVNIYTKIPLMKKNINLNINTKYLLNNLTIELAS